MQRISVQRLAVIFISDAFQRARAPHVDTDGKKHHYERHDARRDFDAMEKKPFECFVDDPNACPQQQARLDESREVLYFSVTIPVISARRFVGYAYRIKCDKRRDEV